MILVIGAGVAGLSCARAAAERGADVTLVTPGRLRASALGGVSPLGGASAVGGDDAVADALGGGNTAMAQGGIAAAVGPGDSTASHLADTLAAGAGIVDQEAAESLVTGGAAAVSALLSARFAADRGPSGALSLGLEGAHSRPRIVHAGEDRTGQALHSFLVDSLLGSPAAARIRFVEGATVESLTAAHGEVTGAVLRWDDRAGGVLRERVPADAVVLATGGFSALFPRTSNHTGARGDGIVLAARAGALVADLEFVQFHPTVLDGTGHLISEALRGAGALLRDARGRRFMCEADPRAELAPRDVVAREIHRVMLDQGGAPVLLDATGIEEAGGPGTLARRFPAISAAVAARGLDWAREPIPVSPAAHYTMGGVLSDLDGRTTVPGLFVAGEVAATGVHGANRLASNSLLEGLVYGASAGRAASDHVSAAPASRGWELRGEGCERLAAEAEATATLPPAADAADAANAANMSDVADMADPDNTADIGAPRDHLGAEAPGGDDGARARVAAAVASGLGIERDAHGITEASRAVAAERGRVAVLAALALEAALIRTESRGAHQRADHPAADPGQQRRRAFIPRFASAAAAEAAPAAPAAAKTASPDHLTTSAAGRPGSGRSLSSC